MYQNINLLPKLPELPQQKFSVEVMLLGIVAWLFVLLLIGGILYVVVSSKENKLKQLQQAKTEMTQSLDKMKSGLAASKVGEKQESEIDEALSAVNKMIALVTEQQQLSVHGLSRYLKDLAEYTPKGVWLTGMNFIPNDGLVELQGKAEQAVLVPEFLKQLTDAPNFDGQHFNVLNIMKSADDQKHPCVAFEISTVKAEANASLETKR